VTPPRRGTPTTSFRLDPALIVRAKVRAAERGETLTDVVRRALTEYAALRHDPLCTHFDAADLAACPNAEEET